MQQLFEVVVGNFYCYCNCYCYWSRATIHWELRKWTWSDLIIGWPNWGWR